MENKNNNDFEQENISNNITDEKQTQLVQKKKTFKKRSIIIILGIAFFLLVGLGALIIMSQSSDEEPRVTTVSKSSLEKIMEIEDLSLISYTYNAVAKVYKSDKRTLKYSVAYEGKVNIGIDFTKIEINLDKENKIITMVLPELEIKDYTVDAGSLDFIFTNDKYETENVTQEAYQECEEDLRKRVQTDIDLNNNAKEIASSTIEALFKPWLVQFDENYVLDIK